MANSAWERFDFSGIGVQAGQGFVERMFDPPKKPLKIFGER
jgi:hypothetical protein